MSLKEKALQMNAGQGIPFMEGRTKEDVTKLLGKIVTVDNYGFINGDDGEYLVFAIEEDSNAFYFGGLVMTEHFKQFSDFEKKEIERDGIPCLLQKVLNKKGKREYVNCTFYPEDALADPTMIPVKGK